ncbi:Na+:solute symporter [Streptomyces violaceorubidus]
MAMCSSDANAIAAVFTRDVAPVLSKRARGWGRRSGLLAARLTTVIFLGLSMAVATQVDSPTFKDIITVVIKWVAGLMGPIAIPMMLGLLRAFRRSGPTAALTSWGLGLIAFWLVNYPINWNVDGGVPLEYQVSVPLAVSLILYVLVGYLKPEDTPERLAIIERVNTDGDGDASGAAAAIPAQKDDEAVKPVGRSQVGD